MALEERISIERGCEWSMPLPMVVYSEIVGAALGTKEVEVSLGKTWMNFLVVIQCSIAGQANTRGVSVERAIEVLSHRRKRLGVSVSVC